jgi:hypothetical protein
LAYRSYRLAAQLYTKKNRKHARLCLLFRGLHACKPVGPAGKVASRMAAFVVGLRRRPMLARSEARGGGCPAGGDRDKVAQSAALYAPVLGETHREPQGTIDPALHSASLSLRQPPIPNPTLTRLGRCPTMEPKLGGRRQCTRTDGVVRGCGGSEDEGSRGAGEAPRRVIAR